MPLGTERDHHCVQRGGQPVRGFEEDHGAALVREAGQHPGPFPGLARQETLKTEPVHGQPRHRERHQHRARTGGTGDPNPGRNGGGNEPITGVAHRRHPGIGDEDDPLPRGQPLEQLDGRGGLVVFVIADDLARRGDLERGT